MRSEKCPPTNLPIAPPPVNTHVSSTARSGLNPFASLRKIGMKVKDPPKTNPNSPSITYILLIEPVLMICLIKTLNFMSLALEKKSRFFISLRSINAKKTVGNAQNK